MIELSCRQQEAGFKSRLAGLRMPDRVRAWCTQVAQAAQPGGSYMILVSCIQQELAALERLTPLPQDRGSIELMGRIRR